MTDSRPEITAKADRVILGDGENTVFVRADESRIMLRISKKDPWWGSTGEPVYLTPQECFALQCQLSAAFQAVAEQQYEQGTAALSIDTEGRLEATMLPVAKPAVSPAMQRDFETWRDREPLL